MNEGPEGLEGLGGLTTALADRYRIDVGPDGQPVVLGRGGMATVYRALDLKHERQVAIKVLHPQLSAIIGADRFVTEIRVTAKLQHPHIVPLLDSGVVRAGETGGQALPRASRGDARPYYVMPLVAGETLAARLAREKRLPVNEALHIVEQVASALDYAHEQGVIHRDIKPSNVLLSGGFALVVDFGLARAVDRSTEAGESTVSGMAVGTPYYMSPEQARGDAELDGRSDIYSLGCMLFEMLAGTPPFTDASPYTLLARHRAAPVPSLRVSRPEVPRAIEEAVATALSKEPSTRFSSAGAFFTALTSGRSRMPPSRKMTIVAAVFVLGAMVSWLAIQRPIEVRTTSAAAIDTMRYLVIPSEDTVASALLQASLERWTGISVVQPFQVQEALARRGGGLLNADGRRGLARSLGAGRYVRVLVSPMTSRSRVDAVLYESGRGTIVREVSTSFGGDTGEADSAFAILTDRLLFGVTAPIDGGRVQPGSRSLPARQALLRGQAALAEWNLLQADSAFAEALRMDPAYAMAALWLAQVRVWSRAPPGTWQVHAEQAAAARGELSLDDRERADALIALRRGDIPGACSRWKAITDRRPADFTGWYSLATCLYRDSIVVPDRSSRSRWRFRSSYAAAISAYQRAFELLPTVSRSFRRESYEDLQRLLWTSRTGLRPGWAAPPDTTWFLAYLAYQGDSITPLPFPALQVMTQAPPIPLAEMNEAEVRQRYRFRDITASWVRAYPTSAEALEAHSVGLDLLGDPSAADTLHRARLLATDPAEQRRVAVSEVWLRLKLSLPTNESGLRAARALADTLLADRSPRTGRESSRLASLAALTGRAIRARDLAVEGTGDLSNLPIHSDLPIHLERRLRALLVFASLGGPLDSLRAVDADVEQGIEESVPATSRGPVGLDWALSTSLVYPDLAMRGLKRLRGKGSPLLDVQAAADAGDPEPARAYIVQLRRQRTSIPPHDVGLDGLYPEARLLLASGDTAGAAAWLDPTLSSLRLTQPTVLVLAGRPGALVRAMALRADLASWLGDREAARQWARTVIILWSDADLFLQPLVNRMAQLAR